MSIPEGFRSIQHKTATTEISEDSLTYGENVLKTKFPSYMDGLKDVTRRILWISNDAKELTPMLQHMGDVVAIHTSGESSVYEAMVRLAQDFMVGHPFVHIKGKSGKYYNPGGAAAPRYVKTQTSEWARDVFFTGVHPKTIPMRVGEKDNITLEPKYFIPRIPTALVLGNLTVGFGYKSHIHMLDTADVCDIVREFSEHYQNGNIGTPKFSVLAKYCVPSFPIPNIVKNKPELIRDYSQGIFDSPVSVEGWVDLSANTITMRAVPYGIDFSTVTHNIRSLLMDKKHWLWNHLTTMNFYSSKTAEVVLELKRGQNPFVVMEMLKSLMRFNTNWAPIHSYMKDGRALTLHPIALTQLWYQERAISIASGLKYRQVSAVNKRMLLEAMLAICEHTDRVIEIIKRSSDEEESARQLNKEFENLTWKQCKLIAGQKLSIITKNNKVTITEDIEQTDVDLATILASFDKVNETIYQDASYLKKKYGSTKVSQTSSDFKGCVQFGNLGIIQFFGDDDLYDILNSRWGNIPKYIHFYDSRWPLKYIIRGSKLVPLNGGSKEIACEGVILKEHKTLGYTLIIGKEGMYFLDGGNVTIPKDTTICSVTKEFFGLKKDGSWVKDSVDNYQIRKNTGKGIRSRYIYAIPINSNYNDVVVFHMNTSSTRVLRAEHIVFDNRLSKLPLSPLGDNEVILVCPYGSKNVLLNIPASCRKGTTIEHILIKDVSAIFTKSNSVSIPLNGKSNQFKISEAKTYVTLKTPIR